VARIKFRKTEIANLKSFVDEARNKKAGDHKEDVYADKAT